MKFEEIQDEWEKDRPKAGDDLARASLQAAYIHAKYHKILRAERKLKFELEFQYKSLLLLKTQYYLGQLSLEQLKENGWTPCLLRIIKSDVGQHLEADRQLQDMKLKLFNQTNKVEYLTDLITNQINKIGYAIKNSIDYLKFTNGQG